MCESSLPLRLDLDLCWRLEVISRSTPDPAQITPDQVRQAFERGAVVLLSPSGPACPADSTRGGPPGSVSHAGFPIYCIPSDGGPPVEGGRARGEFLGTGSWACMVQDPYEGRRGECAPAGAHWTPVCSGCGVAHPSMGRSGIGFATLWSCCRSVGAFSLELLLQASACGFPRGLQLGDFLVLVDGWWSIGGRSQAQTEPSNFRWKNPLPFGSSFPQNTRTHTTKPPDWITLPLTFSLAGCSRSPEILLVKTASYQIIGWKPIGSLLEPPTGSTLPTE